MLIQIVALQIMTLLAIIFILRKFLYTAAHTEIKRLQMLSEEGANKSRELTAKIEEAQRQYEDKIREAKDEAERLKTQALEEIEKLKQVALAKARQEGERVVKQALQSKEIMREELASEIQGGVIVYALQLVRTGFSDRLCAKLHALLCEEALSAIGELPQEKVSAAHGKTALRSAYPLSDEQKGRLTVLLKEKTGQDLAFQETAEPRLLAGFVLTLGSLVIDGSLENKFQEAAKKMKEGI